MTSGAATLLSQKPPVIVVGSGLAGLAAAMQLLTYNIPVRVIERFAKPGGNSMKASSGINGAPTRFQPISSGVDNKFLSDTLKSAGTAFGTSSVEEKQLRERLISTLTNSSADAVYWLTDENKIDLSKVAQLGGHSFPRTHRGGPGQKPPGASIVLTLLGELKKNPNFELQTNSRVVRLLKESGKIVGVEYEQSNEGGEAVKKSLNGPVVFASGGFAGDAHGLMARYRPDLNGFPSTNDAREGTQPLLTAVGAGLVDMDRVQVHPTGFIDPKNPWAPVKILAAEMLRGEGGILVDNQGRRFVNELDMRDKVTGAIYKSTEALSKPEGEDSTEGATQQWGVKIVLDEATAEATSSHLGFYQWKGLIRKTTAGELGSSMIDTLRGYGNIVSGKERDPFNRPVFGSWNLGTGLTAESKEITEDTVLYVGDVTPVVHFTMGGVTIDEESKVLDTEGAPIPGLWAAGEITGGVHGDNRLGGSSLLECVVFGRIAGDGAAKYYESAYAKI